MEMISNLILFISQNFIWITLLELQVLSYGSYTILVHLCEENGQISFSSTALNFLIEFFKLIFSLSGLIVSHSMESFKSKRLEKNYEDVENQKINVKTFSYLKEFSFSKSLYFAIPAILYFINNNLAVYIQLYMDSTSYQMLSNFKIFTTAILYYLIMKQSLSNIKWFSLTLLFFAGVFYVFGNLKSLSSVYVDQADLRDLVGSSDLQNKTPIKYRLQGEIYVTGIGFVMVIAYCIISGLSGVYNEYILKRNYLDSIFVQNIYLYVYGSLLNFIVCLIDFIHINESEIFDLITWYNYFFKGFSIYAWTIVITQVFNGFTMSIVMKYSNNITRIFVISSSLVVTTVLSVLVFSLKLNLYFYFGFFTILLAIYLYNSS